MAKVGQPIRGRKPPSYGRKVVVRVSEGVAIVQAWPKRRGRPRNPVTVEQNLRFSEANKLAKYAPSDDQWMAIEVAKDGPLYPRDLLMSAMFGRLFETLTVDGRRMVSMAVIQDISSDLDLIGSGVQGAVLFRGQELWQGVGPGAVGDVLTSAGAGGNPFWSAAAGGAGKYIATNNPGIGPSASAFATKGSLIAAARAVTVWEMGCMITAVAGQTYRGRIWSLTAGRNIVALVGDTGPVTGLAAARQIVWRALTVPAVLAAGTNYYFAWSRTDGIGTSSVPVHGTHVPNELTGFPELTFNMGTNRSNYSWVATVNPAAPQNIPIIGASAFFIPLVVSI